MKNGRSVRDPEDSGDELSYNEKIKQYRAMVWRIRSILVVLAAVVIVLAAMFVSNRHFSRAELIPVREFASEDGASCISFADYILQYGPNGATCADKDGRVKWSITYEMDQPILDISGNIAAIADYGGRTIYVMNTAKQLYSVTTSLPIHKVSASESGEVAAVMDDTSVTWIRLYSKTGKEIAYFVRSMEENGYPMDVAVSPNGEAVCVSNLMMKDTTVKTVISFYNFGKAGKNYDQHKVVDFEYDNEVFPYVRYMGNNICTAASDSRFVVFDTSSVEPKNSINNMITDGLAFGIPLFIMAVGAIFAGMLADEKAISFSAALALSIGIAIQNFPEGAIVSMPLKSEGQTKLKAFTYGALSGLVEPVGAVLTILLSKIMVPVLPYLLSFAAGAMIFVTVEETIPEASEGKHSNLATVGFAAGFILMMILDTSLG